MVSSDQKGLPDDYEPGSLREKAIRRRGSRVAFVLKGIDAIFVFCFVKLFGRLAYEGKYLKGKHFAHFWSPGWRWAFNGMFSKLFTAKGRGIPWPMSSQCTCGRNVCFGVDELNLFQGSIYYQTFGDAKITIGEDVWIARGCCLITANHDLVNPSVHVAPQDIVIGDHCWLGANVVIMPGVVLGPHTVVGANAVVTKSMPEGNCVLAGIPARKLKDIQPNS